MARECFFRARRASAGTTIVKDKVFFGCFHVHTVSMAWGVYQLITHALALLVLMFFACRLHKAHQAYVEQQHLVRELQSSSNNGPIASNNDMMESYTSYLLIQQSNDSFLELVVSSDSNNDQPLNYASSVTINGVPVSMVNNNNNKNVDSVLASNSDAGSMDVIGNFGSDVDDPSAKLAASWGNLHLTEGKITARELRLGFFATLMALLTVCMFLYGIATRKPVWMIPHYALQVLDVIIGSLTFVGILFYAPRVDRYFHRHYAVLRRTFGAGYDASDIDCESKAIAAERVMLGFLLCSMFLLLILKGYLLVAIWRCMRYFRALEILRTSGAMPRSGVSANGYAELGVVPPPFDSETIGGGKSAYAGIANNNNSATSAKKNSLPRYESAVAAEFAGVPPPPYEEKLKLTQ